MPALSFKQLDGALRKSLHPLYLLHGDETLLLQEAQDAIRAVARAQGYTERSCHTVSGAHFDWSAIFAAISSQSLFADKQIVEIHIPSGKPGKEGSNALQRIAHAASGNGSTLTLLALPRLDKTSRSSTWFTALDKVGVSIAIEPVERTQLSAWIAQRLALQGQQVESGETGQRTLQFFADRVEGNLLAAHQEVQKLALLYPKGTLSQAQIETAVFNVARYNVFQLSQAALSGQVARTQRMLDGLQAEGEAAVLVHWALADDIRALKRTKDAMQAGKPLPVALRENRIWGEKERLFARILPEADTRALARLVQSAHVVDGIVKGLRTPDWPGDSWQALHRLAFQMCRLVI